MQCVRFSTWYQFALETAFFQCQKLDNNQNLITMCFNHLRSEIIWKGGDLWLYTYVEIGGISLVGRHRNRYRHIFQLSILKGTRNYNTSMEMSTHTVKILVSKYHSPPKRTIAPLKKKSESRARTGKMQEENEAHCTRM